MKKRLAILLSLTCLLLAARVHAETPAQAAIAAAHSALSKPQAGAADHVALALALLRRSRETGLGNDLAEADAALTRALALAPQDYVAQRTRVALMLARNANADALARITALRLRFPDDLESYALLIDAELALGRYTDAERDTQGLLDLRPDNPLGLNRAARLRELYGDADGAIECLNGVLNSVAETEIDERAGLLSELARLQVAAGRPDVARELLNAALVTFPDYHLALAERVRLETISGDRAAALSAAQRLYRVAPTTDNLYVLARASAAGGDAEAPSLFKRFVRDAEAVAEHDDNANLALSDYYAEQAKDPARALVAAERSHSGDWRTLVTHAWALYRSGHAAQAVVKIEILLALGCRDIDLLYKAGEILAAGAKPGRATEVLSLAVAAAPRDPRARAAQALLAQLATTHLTAHPPRAALAT